MYKSPLRPLYWPFIKLENNEIGRKYFSNDILIVSRYLCVLYGNIGLWYEAVLCNIVDLTWSAPDLSHISVDKI